jgi:hypothetical protein
MKHALLILIALGLTSATLAPAVMAEDAPASQPAAKEPVAYAKLKAVLPETFVGLKRTNASGSKSSFGAMKLSQADGTYGEGDKTASISIIDYGAMPGMLDGLTAWSKMEIDNDSDTESTKTTKVGTYPAMETFRKEAKDADVTIAVGSRFLVTVKSTGAPLDDVRKELAKLDLKAVEAAGK